MPISQHELRSHIRQLVPGRLREWLASGRLRELRRHNQGRSAQEVFSEIYEQGRWGTGDSFDSGSGSRGVAAQSYVELIRRLIRDNNLRTAVDVGCGDFRVAAGFVADLESYHGIDVAPQLIEHNTARFGQLGVTFSTEDATSCCQLPPADVCLVRQVLQHLSNEQVAALLSRCAHYPLVVVTEHWPAPQAMRRSNVDKPHGPDTRLDRGSWVDITAAPFHRTPVREVLRIAPDSPLFRQGETIRTHIWLPRQHLTADPQT